MTAQTSPASTQPRASWRPNPIALGVARTKVELTMFVRDPMSMFFIALFPVLMLVMFTGIFGSVGDKFIELPGGTGITAAQYYVPTMLALGAMLVGFQTCLDYVNSDRFDGTIKRLAGTPLPSLAYFLGKIGMIAVIAVVQAVLLLGIGHFVYDVQLPPGLTRWAIFIGAYLLGVIAFTALGIAAAAVPRSQKGGTAIAVPVTLVLSFISGIYISLTMLPGWMRTLGGVFPLRWLGTSMRHAFLPDAMAAAEPGGVWRQGLAFAVMGAWAIGGIIVARLTFAWPPKR